MADISPIARPSIAAYTRLSEVASAPSQTPGSPAVARGDDAVQLSTHARLLSRLQELPDVRQDVVDRVTQAINDGTYESSEKINAAVDGLLEDLA